MSKPLLEINLLHKEVEAEILFELRNKHKMQKAQAELKLVQMRKDGLVDKAVKNVLKGWF